jgi:hypothetical protein
VKFVKLLALTFAERFHDVIHRFEGVPLMAVWNMTTVGLNILNCPLAAKIA